MSGMYLFLLGLASGLTLLTLTAYRHVSPTWLKWLLMSTGLLVMSRYVVMGLFTHPEAFERYWALRRCWLMSSIGLTLPSVMVLDQLLRHPAMSPKKLLQWCSPIFAVYILVILFGSMHPQPDPVLGWSVHLSLGWQLLLSIVQLLFVLGFVSCCVLLMRKIPSRPIRTALFGLTLAYLYLGVDELLLSLGHWYFKPFLFSEMLTLLALWYAYETSAKLQHS